jgi:pyridoxal phosphate enzyme (YggS family)
VTKTRTELELALRMARRAIAEACARSQRSPDHVTLIAVTKGVPTEVVQVARDLGVENFGENFAGALAEKATHVPARWHFLGKVQRGTAARVVRHAQVIHGGEPGTGLERVARRAESEARVLECLAQVDFTGRRQGVRPEDVVTFLEQGSRLPGLRWVGLMTLPPWTGHAEGARPYFRRLRQLRDDLLTRWPGLRGLSMGMSGDYEVAVEEGATMVRLGTALFGQRPDGRPGGP